MSYSFDDSNYEDVAQLAVAHGSNSLFRLGREFYKRTECGVSTCFLTADGEKFHYEVEDARVYDEMPNNQWPIRNVVGIRISTIVEGHDAEFSEPPLYFPFTDRELAAVWDKLQAEVDEFLEEED